MSLNSELAKSVADLLKAKDIKLVLAESCTGGKVSGKLVEIPGISEHLCGSFVVYRVPSKMGWLDVPQDLFEKFTAESQQSASAISRSALAKTPEADISLGVAGFEDGNFWISINQRLADDTIIEVHKIELPAIGGTRPQRLKNIVTHCLSHIAIVLNSVLKCKK